MSTYKSYSNVKYIINFVQINLIFLFQIMIYKACYVSKRLFLCIRNSKRLLSLGNQQGTIKLLLLICIICIKSRIKDLIQKQPISILLNHRRTNNLGLPSSKFRKNAQTFYCKDMAPTPNNGKRAMIPMIFSRSRRNLAKSFLSGYFKDE